MSPSLLSDQTSESNLVSSPLLSASRTLLLAPPSIAAHEERLLEVLADFDRKTTDLQMMDRLSNGIATLPHSTYDMVLVLAGVDGTRSESTRLLDRKSFQQVFLSLKPGGKFKTQNTILSQDRGSTEFREAILAGLVLEDGEIVKPQFLVSETVPLRFLRRKDKDSAFSSDEPLNENQITNVVKSHSRTSNTGNESEYKKDLVGFDDDEDLVDEDTLLTEEEMHRPLNIPAECAPRAGKRRRACKDCTCGLAERLAAEESEKISKADAQLRTLKLEADDLSEVDFTVKGKIGSCGNCSLGDAFRCVGCPFVGMPAFKPGEEVRLLNDVVQL
ncbi:Fe-S cluster assembly protein dre2 [Golovinomyces cichoracearum]|uniref:Fe-S cluster assembly protein dre2 n=1 Tax=Golovinomyces cichoracearum TaxID=62708 RepID=A0A420J5H6_9PEZI|nr:Fe-S cluster assembly protein dre2 [Golovinomyces cichoracearum]